MSTLIAGKRGLHGGSSPALRTLVALLAGVLLGGALALAGAQAASAHAELVSTAPEDGDALEQAPAEAELTFNEPVQLIDGSIRLFPGDDSSLTLDARVSDTSVVATIPADVGDGAYALSYRVVSADGHPISGAITFTVGDAAGAGPGTTPVADGTTPVVETATPQDTQFAVSALTALQYLTLLIFSGLVLFERLVLRATGTRDRRTSVVLRSTGIGAVAASLLLIPVSALNVTGESLAAFVNPTAWWPGLFWAPVVAAVVVIAGVVGAAVLSQRGGASLPRMLGVLLAFIALCAPVLVGHTQLIQPGALIIAADVGHLLAGSFWAGGTLGLFLYLLSARATDDHATEADPQGAATVVQRFSRLAVWSVIVLAISGVIMGVMIVGSFEALATTGYGLTLLLKVTVVLPVVAIAAYNRFRLLPRLAARPTARGQWRVLTRVLTYEAALLAAVLLLTGFLTNLSPNHDHHEGPATDAVATEADGVGAAADSDVGSNSNSGEGHSSGGNGEPVSIAAEAQGLSVDGSIGPLLAGENEMSFTLEYEGEPVTPDEVTLRASLPEHDLGPFEVTAELDTATGGYTALVDMPVAGDWEIKVSARVSTFAQPIVTIPVTVN